MADPITLPDMPTTWTSPDGTTYDLWQSFRDGSDDAWHHSGWSISQDGDAVPTLTVTNDIGWENPRFTRVPLPIVVDEYGLANQPNTSRGWAVRVESAEGNRAADAVCRNCERPFDPADDRFDGHARSSRSPYCRRCVYDDEYLGGSLAVEETSTVQPRIAKLLSGLISFEEYPTPQTCEQVRASLDPDLGDRAGFILEPISRAELRALRTPASAATSAESWTDAGGTTYDLTQGQRDRDGDVWVCEGWWEPFDGDRVPVMVWGTDRETLPEVIRTYGPLTERSEG